MVPRRAPRGLLPFLFQLLGMHVFLGLRLHVWLDISFEDQHSTPWGFPGDASGKKIPPTMQEMQEMQVPSLGWEDPLEKEMATHSSILAWEISWTKEPGGLQFMCLQIVGHDWALMMSADHQTARWLCQGILLTKSLVSSTHGRNAQKHCNLKLQRAWW